MGVMCSGVISLQNNATIKAILETVNIICAEKAYLVGGCVRDILLGRTPHDLDLAVAGNSGKVAKDLAKIHPVKVVELDEVHDIWRIIIADSCLDIVGLGEKPIEMDLKRRDFTINAMAVPVKEYLRGNVFPTGVIDPLDGLADLHSGIIRACSPRSIEDDPVRILRALRFQAELGFSINDATTGLMRSLKRSLASAPGERIWRELRFIMALPGAANVFVFLDKKTKALGQLFPEIFAMRNTEQNHYHSVDVWAHSLNTLVYFERFMENNNWSTKLNGRLRKYLKGPLQGTRKRLPVVKLACLFHDLGKPKTRDVNKNGRITFHGHHIKGGPMVDGIASRLRLSKRERQLLRLLVEWHMQPLFLYKDNPPTEKALVRFFRTLGEDVPGCLLLSLADVSSSRISIGQKAEVAAYTHYIKGLLEHYYAYVDRALNTAPLLTGDEIIALVNVKPSPLVGEIKDALIDAQGWGIVATHEEAEEFVKKTFGKKLIDHGQHQF